MERLPRRTSSFRDRCLEEATQVLRGERENCRNGLLMGGSVDLHGTKAAETTLLTSLKKTPVLRLHGIYIGRIGESSGIEPRVVTM